MNEDLSSTIHVGGTDHKIRLYPEPPPGFDPQTAEDRLLRLYGFPARPDAGGQPELREQWNRVISRIRGRVRPEFRVDPNRFHGARRAHPVIDDPQVSSNWSGSVLVAPTGDTWQWVMGQWTVPSCDNPTPGPGPDCFSAAWLGIDGGVFNGDPRQDVVQAGSESDSSPGGGRNIFLWWEWAPAIPQVVLTNFPVNSGDLMMCMICVEPSAGGPVATFFLFNYNSGLLTTFSFAKPVDADFLGNTAEWIVEAPSLGGIFGNTVIQPLTNFGAVFFDQAQAGTVKNVVVNCNDTSSSQIFLFGAVSNQELANPVVENAQCLRVTRDNPALWD